MKEITYGNYTIVILERKGLKEYYLEKNGYSHLYFMFGSDVEMDATAVVDEYIEDAENESFWGDEA